MNIVQGDELTNSTKYLHDVQIQLAKPLNSN